MAGRPWFAFYANDWLEDKRLRLCSLAAQGMWIRLLCIMHDCEPYGYLKLNGTRLSEDDIAQLVGCSVDTLRQLLGELTERGVPRCTRDGIIYSKRMVEDERIRKARAEGGIKSIEHPNVQKPRKNAAKNVQKTCSKNAGDEHDVEENHKDKPSSKDTLKGSTQSQSQSHITTVPTPNGVGVGESSPPSIHGAEDEEPDDSGHLPCPHQKIVQLYLEILDTSPAVAAWNDTRAGYLRQRWREKAKANGKHPGYSCEEDGLAWWRRYFNWVKQSKFLTGQVEARKGHKPFIADLEWLIKPSNFLHVLEGKYHDDE